MEQNLITEYFEEVETTKEYDGYFCSVAQAITLVLLGSISEQSLEFMHEVEKNIGPVKTFAVDGFRVEIDRQVHVAVVVEIWSQD